MTVTLEQLNAKQTEALLILERCADAGRAVKESNHTNGDAGLQATIYWQTRRVLEDWGLVRWGNETLRLVELTEEGEQLAAAARAGISAGIAAGDGLDAFPTPPADTDTDTDTDGEQPAAPAPAARLPEFEGEIPVGVLTKVVGTSQRITHAVHHRQRGVAVVEWECTGIAFPLTDEGVKRVQTLKVLDLLEVTDPGGRKLLNELKLAQDPSPLPFKTKADGEIFGDAADALGLTGTEPVAVVFAGGARAAWPDDFPDATARPEAGAYIDVPGQAGPDTVVELLDMVTGERVAVYDDEEQVPDGAPGAGEED